MTATVTERTVEMYPLKSRLLEVGNVRRITPRMVRVDLGGSDIAGLRSDNFADHVKLWFPNPETGEHVLPVVEDDRCLNFRAPGVIYRDYTVRRFDAKAGLLTIDFVVHDNGPGGRWAATAQPGDRLGVLGPRGTVYYPEADHYVLLADETALPAAARRIEELPRDASVTAFFEVADAAEEQELDAPEGAEITWLHRNGAAPGTTDLLLRALEQTEFPKGRVFVWAGGEADALKPIRRLLKERGLVRGRDFEVDGYWRRGVSNLDHHAADDDDE